MTTIVLVTGMMTAVFGDARDARLFGIMGAISFLLIVVSGLRFSLSRGNSESVAKARNSIIYSAVGLVISMLAFAIVRFVVRSV